MSGRLGPQCGVCFAGSGPPLLPRKHNTNQISFFAPFSKVTANSSSPRDFHVAWTPPSQTDTIVLLGGGLVTENVPTKTEDEEWSEFWGRDWTSSIGWDELADAEIVTGQIR